jgi:hypothetical protein
MHLKATKVDFPNKLVKIKLADTKNLYNKEGDIKWSTSLDESIKTKGMLHPIIVCTEDDLKDGVEEMIKQPFEYEGYKWRVITGNNRYFYAVSAGYKTIDAYHVRTKQEHDEVHNVTVLEAHEF